jgi:mRNA-degrading endonuclease RelE of RelBE toxin-antitoxin system
MDPLLKRKMRAALEDILDDPASGKALRGELEGLWSLRVGRHRVIYRPDNEGAAIVAIGPRRTIYEATAKQIARQHRRQGS